MPYRLEIDPTIPLVTVHGIGDVSVSDFQDAMSHVITSEAIEFPQLVNLSNAKLHISPMDVRKYVHFKREYLSKYKAVRVAAIASDPTSYGMLRMYQSLIWEHEPEFYVFYTVEEGILWLAQGAT